MSVNEKKDYVIHTLRCSFQYRRPQIYTFESCDRAKTNLHASFIFLYDFAFTKAL